MLIGTSDWCGVAMPSEIGLYGAGGGTISSHICKFQNMYVGSRVAQLVERRLGCFFFFKQKWATYRIDRFGRCELAERVAEACRRLVWWWWWQ